MFSFFEVIGFVVLSVVLVIPVLIIGWFVLAPIIFIFEFLHQLRLEWKIREIYTTREHQAVARDRLADGEENLF